MYQSQERTSEPPISNRNDPTSTSNNNSRQAVASTSAFNSMNLGQKLISQCAICGDTCESSPNRLQPCLFCGTVAYCSLEHQQFDWKRHKMLCKTLQARGLVNSNVMSTVPNASAVSEASSSGLNNAFSRNSEPAYVSPSHAKFSIASKVEEPFSRSVPGTFQNISLGGSSAFRPYREVVGNSFSSDSVSSLTTSNYASSSFDRLSSPSLASGPQLSSAFPNTSSVVSNLSAASQTPPPMLNSMASVASTSAIQVPIKVLTISNGTEETIIETDDPDIQIIEGGSTTSTKVPRPRKRPTPSTSAELNVNYKDHNKNVVYSTTLQEHQRHLQNRGLALNLHQAMVLRLRYIAEHVIRSLNEFGWAVVDNFLGSDHYKYTAMEIERLYKRGLFSAGQLMEGKNKDECHIKDIRSDQIYWYDGTDTRAKDAATVRLLISMIDSVIQHFKKRIAHDIGGRSRAMIAIYPGSGTRYVKHVDNPVKDGRCITTIYYCNENWDMGKDGGTLRLYPETSMTPMDIDPRADRLVFFWSDRRNPHEVMPVYRHRFAITIWYMDKEERDKALARGKENPAAAREEEALKAQTASSQLETPPQMRKNTSTVSLSSLDLRLFPSTSSDPILARSLSKEDDQASLRDMSSTTLNHPESTDSGVSVDDHHHHHHLHRINSLQSVSDAFKAERNIERRSSTSSDNDMEEPLPPPPVDNPEYII